MMDKTANKVKAEAHHFEDFFHTHTHTLLALNKRATPHFEGEAEFRTYTKFENFCTLVTKAREPVKLLYK